MSRDRGGHCQGESCERSPKGEPVSGAEKAVPKYMATGCEKLGIYSYGEAEKACEEAGKK